MRNVILTILTLGVVGGCSPEAHRQSADRQVKQILRQREERTLGYRPEVDVPTTAPAAAGAAAFAPIPTTPIPPPTLSPMEPAVRELPFAPAGPRVPLVVATQAVDRTGELFGLEAARRQSLNQLRYIPPLPDPRIHRFDLFASVGYAVQHSRGYQNQMEEVYLAALDVTLQRHLFDPRPFVQTGATVTGGGADVSHRAALNATATAGVRQKLPYGGEVVARTLVGLVQAISGNVSDGETAEVALTASVPLLRGAGMVNLEALISSERQLVYRLRQFEDFRRQFAVTVAGQYFRLVTAQQNVANRRADYVTRMNTTERVVALYEATRINFDQVQRARQAQLSAENSLINAQQSYQSQVDAFKVTLGMPLTEDLEIVPVELTVQVPDTEMDEVVRLAIQYRLDLQTARDQIEDGRRDVAIAQNGLLPDLNLTGGVQVGNRAGTPLVDVRGNTVTYDAGVVLDLPVDRLAERNAYRRSLISYYQAQRSYDDLRDRVTLSARDSLRNIRSAEMTLRIQQVGIELARQRLDLINEKLKAGSVNQEEVENAQNSLLEAQTQFETARATFQTNLLQYLQQTGTLRVDPQAGALGRAMDRTPDDLNKSAPGW